LNKSKQPLKNILQYKEITLGYWLYIFFDKRYWLYISSKFSL